LDLLVGKKQLFRTLSRMASIITENPKDNNESPEKIYVQQLTRAVAETDRLNAIVSLRGEFDHWDADRHDREIAAGAAIALMQKLGYALSVQGSDEEVVSICSVLEMVYRASSEKVASSFSSMGGTIVLPLMIRTIDRCINDGIDNNESAILNIVKVLSCFSRENDAAVEMAHNEEFMNSLLRVVNEKDATNEVKLMSMRTIANLSHAKNNMEKIAQHPCLLESVIDIAANNACDRTREQAVRIIQNLACSSVNQVPMVQNDKILDVLVELTSDLYEKTRRGAARALQNLAFARKNRLIMATYGDGALLESLVRLASSDEYEHARLQATKALENLINHDTIEVLGSHEGLLEALAAVASLDGNEEVRSKAANAFKRLAAKIVAPMKCHSNLLKALSNVADNDETVLASVILRQATVVENCAAMDQDPGILEALARIAYGPKAANEAREYAVKTLQMLHENRLAMMRAI